MKFDLRATFSILALLMVSCTPATSPEATDAAKISPEEVTVEAPIALAGADIVITLPTSSVVLNGSVLNQNSYPLTYSWSKLSGGNAIIASEAAASTSISGLTAGSYVFRLTVSNSKSTRYDDISVTVNSAPNSIPVVSAGVDKSLTLPVSNVTLSGSATDANSDTLNYAWSKVSGGTATISSPGNASANITGLVTGSYSFRLTVSDGNGGNASDDVVVIVKMASNIPPIAAAGKDINITLPVSSVNLVGSATDANSDAITFSWAKVSGGVATIVSPSTASTNVTGLVAGTYVFRITANDGKGGIGSDDVSVVVNNLVNAAPVASAGADKAINLPASTVALAGSGIDANGDVLTYAWTKTSGGSATIVSPSAAATNINGLVEGSYSFRLTVSDSKGGVGSDDVAVVVGPALVAGLDPNAGKISLWIRQGTVYPTNWDYDAAVFLPADYGANPSKMYPMILSLHGLGGTVMDTNHTAVGGNKEGFIKQVWGTPLANTFGAIVIAPSARPKGSSANKWWTWTTNKRLIEAALVKYKIDPKRVVVTGLSAGGLGTSELAKNAPQLIAGAMQGAFNDDTFNPDTCSLNAIPFWSFGNRSDGTFQPESWEGTAVVAKSCANFTGKLKLNVYESTCGHGCWDAHWQKPEVQDWLVNQVKP